jgi:hypothetical protein
MWLGMPKSVSLALVGTSLSVALAEYSAPVLVSDSGVAAKIQLADINELARRIGSAVRPNVEGLYGMPKLPGT